MHSRKGNEAVAQLVEQQTFNLLVLGSIPSGLNFLYFISLFNSAGGCRLKLACPNCGSALADADVNVANNVAFCRACSQAYQLSELVGGGPGPRVNPPFDPTSDPPKGCWYRETMDGWTAGATSRSPIAFFLVPFMCVWSGASLGGIYGSQIVQGKFNPFMSLFGIPFLLGSVLFWAIAAMTIDGKVILTATGDDVTIFTGVWGFGWRQHTTISPDSRIDTNLANIPYPGRNGSAITIEGPKSIRFGSGLSFTRQMFLIQVLRYKFNLMD